MKRESAWYLSGLHIDSFGGFFNRTIGPFKPGMNVVFGKNESGKTTTTAFVTGLLFGWMRTRGKLNTYKPTNAERSGRILFECEDGGEAVISRVRNVDGLEGDAWLIEDIEEETFSTMFALDSDELLSLKSAPDVTAHLLTAGSGTGESPAKALAELDGRIRDCTSRAADKDDSIANLSNRLKVKNAELALAVEEAQSHYNEDRELHELRPRRDELQTRQRALNEDIKAIAVKQQTIATIDGRLDDLRCQRDALLEEQDALDREERAAATVQGDGDGQAIADLKKMSTSEERGLRDSLDTLQRERDRLEEGAAAARMKHEGSRARYEALLASDQARRSEARNRRNRRLNIVLSAILPLVALAVGVALAVYAWMTSSQPLGYLGIGLIAAAVVLGAVALALTRRPDRTVTAYEQEKREAEFAMLEDEKRLAACADDRSNLDAAVGAFLSQHHLASAGTSLERARFLLDEARGMRTQTELFIERRRALEARLKAVEGEMRKARSDRATVLADLGVDEVDAIALLRAGKADEFEAVSQRFNEATDRIARLEQILSAARGQHDFDRLKQEVQVLTTRLAESKRTYARLLLARRDLALAIEAWESKSQPEVYRQASRLFAHMTNGAWQQVRMSAEGELEVVDATHEVREPHLLSLGTCQQLYLSLRIALLMTADSVGRALPILADDILVNFDEERRRSAAEALLELSQHRQVIFFTCHREILELMEGLAPHVNTVRL